MKKTLLLGVAVSVAATVNAIPLHPDKVSVENRTESAVAMAHVKPAKVDEGAIKVAPGVAMSATVSDGLAVKRIHSTLGMSRMVPRVKNSVGKSAKAPARVSEEMSLWESFEGWDGETMPWYPEGWTLDSKTGKTGTEATTWGPIGGVLMYGLYPVDGETMMVVSYDTEDPTALQDEWLVSPEITVKENEVLKFYAWVDPIFLFSLDNFDWEIWDWIGDKEVTYTLKALVKEEDADWVEVWDASTRWLGCSVDELLAATPSALEPFTVSLSSFEGKKVQIAFQFVGKDSNLTLLDMVTVGLPELDGVVYDDPVETLYFGFDRTAQWRSLTASIATYPVYEPVTWVNSSEIDVATYQWEYCDPVTGDWVTSDDQDLTVTYIPDYRSESSTRNNWFYAPRLYASAPGATPGKYQSPYTYFQAGGKPEAMVNTGGTEPELIDFGLVQFSSSINGMGFVGMEADFGQPSTPIFGYDANVDDWWLNYTFNGDMEDAGDDDHVYVDAIMNMIYPATAPLVITGANILAIGQIGSGAEFKFEVIGLEDLGDGSFLPLFDAPLVSSVCKAENVLVEEGGVQNYLNVIFDFDEPFVINPDSNGYLLRFSGFHDPENIEYFAPMQSMIPFSHPYVIAWIDKYMKVMGAEEYRRSITPTFYYESEYGMCHNAFAMNLSAYYPWLESGTDVIEVPSDGTSVEIALDSYYDGSALTVDAPVGVTATVSGRYGECKLVVAHDDTEVIADGELTVSGHGVKKVFAIRECSGVEGISVDKATSATPIAAFSVTGQPIALKDAVNGIYIVKYSDGRVAKVAVK